MINKHEAYVYNMLQGEYTEENLVENEFLGTTHTALQAAIDYVHNNGGGTVYISSGEYTICGEETVGSATVGGINGLRMYDGIKLEGNHYYDDEDNFLPGDNPAFFQPVFTSSSNELLAAIVTIFGSEATPVKDVSINNIKFEGDVKINEDGSIVYCGYGIFAKHGDGISITNCEFSGFGENVAVYLSKCSNITMGSDELYNVCVLEECDNFHIDDIRSLSKESFNFTSCNNGVISFSNITGNIYTEQSIKFTSCSGIRVDRCRVTVVSGKGMHMIDCSKMYMKSSSMYQNHKTNSTLSPVALFMENVDRSIFASVNVYSSTPIIVYNLSDSILLNTNIDVIDGPNTMVDGVSAVVSIIGANRCSICGMRIDGGTISVGVNGKDMSDCVIQKYTSTSSATINDDDVRLTTSHNCVLSELKNVIGGSINLIGCDHCLIHSSTYRNVAFSGEGNMCDPTMNNQLH